MEAWLAALAYGAGRVLLLATAELPAGVRRELQAQVGYTGAILAGMGYPSDLVELVDGDPEAAQLPDGLHAPAPGATDHPAGFAGLDEKRTTLRLAIEHLWRSAPEPRGTVALPAGAPFGAVLVDREACTLCLSCVSVCPAKALNDGGDLPQLRFIEANCVQCGLCASACPENAIRLTPRYLYEPDARAASRVLNEEIPFHCVRCGKPFATEKMVQRIAGKLQGHWMFQSDEALRRVQMCADCRVRDVFESQRSGPRGI
jgi:ferredoxin